MLKSDIARFLWTFSFCANLGKKYPEIGYFASFLKKMLFDIPKNSAKWKFF